MNTAPFQIIAAPFTLYVAPVGTTFPAIDATPANPWKRIGTSGPLDYFQEGVTISHTQAMNKWRSLGHPGVRKVFRTEVDTIVKVTIADLTLESYAIALNDNQIKTDGVTKTLGISRGLGIATMAVLARGPHASPYGNFPAQYELPFGAQTGSSEVNHRRDQPAALQLEWTILVDFNAEDPEEAEGILRVQFEEAT